MSRAAIYLRLSKATEESTSLEGQQKACQAFCEARDWSCEDVFEDVDVSGFTDVARPGRDALMADLDLFDYVVVYRLDRLARSVADSVAIMKRCEASGAALVSVTEALDMSSPAGKAMAQVIAVFAELESATISARVVASQRRLTELGRWRGGRRPYGYRPIDNPDGPGKILVVDQAEAEVVRRMAKAVLRGESLNAIMRWLNEDGVPTAMSKPLWRVPAVKGVLTRWSVLGISASRSQGQLFDDTGSPITFADPILDRDTFDAVNEALARRARPQGRPPKAASLLKRVIHCGHCGAPMNHRQRTDAKTRGYYCKKYSDFYYDCIGTSITARKVEPMAEERFLEKFGHRVMEPIVPDTSDIQKERARLKTQIKDLEDAYINGGMKAELFASVIERLKRRLGGLPDRRPRPSSGLRYRQWWDTATLQQKSELLARYMRIEVVREPPRVTVSWLR